ncbi:hypothetical protein A8E97_26540 [Burkholderia cenocepacia]|nr:hypothetical protein A8E88_04530 [Burkholderia cenocepacia]ONV99726.1 hypothetical protein A8E89_02845 [Burkholderia cenocepacia]ONW21015.1 hypothetical protein A8E94_04460 [Burkholderia cenocepacia]ONW23745.1 hypothetical protein A8E90_06115 [Burkholderia cenocepacia]ONW38629.1 hypothetical protein A8E93_21055 [Burkholderia cenocepacia]
MRPAELRRLRLLEEENARLKRLLAGLSLGKAMLDDCAIEFRRPTARLHLAGRYARTHDMPTHNLKARQLNIKAFRTQVFWRRAC